MTVFRYQDTVSVMGKFEIAAFIVVLSAISLALNEQKDNDYVNVTCPTWTICNPQNSTCKCGVDLSHIVYCIEDGCEAQVAVLYGFCMTLNKDQTKVVVGSCPYNIVRKILSHYWLYLKVPNRTSHMDGRICGYTKRTGQLCGQCANGTSPPVYSYYPQCVDCPAGTNNWAKYLAVALLPTTLFFLGAVVIKFQATSPHMNAFIFLCQVLSSPPILRAFEKSYFKHHNAQNYIQIAYATYLSIWNLDFFRLLYPPFCLQANASTLKVLSLDYITAAYPLVLIILTYTLVTLHYHNCRLVVWLWKPFLRCCIRFQKKCNIRNSLVDAFATFFLLSYVKFLSASIELLAPTFLWDKWGRQEGTVLYYDGTVEYFSKEHLPYAVLAITVLLVFTLLPILLLCLYPCRYFQRLLNSCHLRSQALHTFMDAFQGCYKNGTNGTRDCRYFSAVYLISRVGIHLSLVFNFLSLDNSVVIALLSIVVLLLSTLRPYKNDFFNKLDILFVVCIIMSGSPSWIMENNHIESISITDRILLSTVILIPVIYPLSLVLYYMWRRSKRLQLVTEKMRAFFSRSTSYHNLDLPQRVTVNKQLIQCS